jgi:hypothetical protein
MSDPVVDGPLPGAAPENPSAGPMAVLSVVSLICGIIGAALGFVGWGLLFAVGGVVLGHLARRKEPANRWVWTCALVAGYVGIAINVVVVISGIVLFVAVMNGDTP